MRAVIKARIISGKGSVTFLLFGGKMRSFFETFFFEVVMGKLRKGLKLVNCLFKLTTRGEPEPELVNDVYDNRKA